MGNKVYSRQSSPGERDKLSTFNPHGLVQSKLVRQLKCQSRLATFPKPPRPPPLFILRLSNRTCRLRNVLKLRHKKITSLTSNKGVI